MLQAIFYARFHPLRGPSIIHQYPPNSILPPPNSVQTPLIEWSSLSAYIIPPYDLCNQSFSICAESPHVPSTPRKSTSPPQSRSSSFRVLGFPISLEDPEYDRNRFTFNICFVLDAATPPAPWESLVRKTARFFESIEREDCVLQIEEDLKGLKLAGEEGYPEREVGTVFYLLERIFEDVNAYGECCVQLPGWGTSTLNLRLEEEEEDVEGNKAVKTKVRSWDVPLLIRPLPRRDEWTWDLTLERVAGFIDGIRHVAKIAEAADVEVKLVKRCVRELVLLRRAMVLDIFHFGAIYTCTQSIVTFVRDEEIQDECRAYVAVPQPNHDDNEHDNTRLPSREMLIDLYTALQPGIQLRDFCLEHADALIAIDIRRLITFGIVKGFLRRIHKYALATDSNASPHPAEPSGKKRSGGGSGSRYSGDEAVREFDRAWRKAALSSGWATPPQGPPPTLQSGSGSLGAMRRSEGEVMHDRLMFYLDGGQPLDRVCAEMSISEKGLLERVRNPGFKCGEVVLFNK